LCCPSSGDDLIGLFSPVTELLVSATELGSAEL
jgi:hypothetical protein